MFAFLPPAKVARTQRSPLSSMEMQDDTTKLTPTVVSALNPFVSKFNKRVRPMSIADAEIRVGGVAMRASVFLSGIGSHSCWIVDENTRLLRLWNMKKPFWQRTAPRMAQIPTFTEDEGLPLFVAELGEDEESLAFCTDYGAVSSLDHSVEFQFFSEGEDLVVSAFACQRVGEVVLTGVGTRMGLIFVAVKTDGERFVFDFDRNECEVSVRTTPLTSSVGSWWRAWIPGMSLASSSRNSEDNFPGSLEFTLIRFRNGVTTQMWAANTASEMFLLDFAPIRRRHPSDTGIRAKWVTNISAVLQRHGRIVAFDEAESQLCCLIYMMPCNGHEASLELVTMRTNNGAVLQTLGLQAVGSLAQTVAEAPLHHTKVYLDEMQQVVTVLSGNYCVRVNNHVGVRSPCSSEDVQVLRGIERPLGSSLLPSGQIATVDINGPVVSICSEDEELTNTEIISEAGMRMSTSQQSRHSGGAWKKSRFIGKHVCMEDMARHVEDILHALRIDTKMSLDSAVLEASEAIYSQAPHKGNWARAYLNVEDDNMVLHVTQSLVRRQQEHRRFLFTVLLHKEVEPFLQPQTIARLLSMQEALLAMVAVRRLQNDNLCQLPQTLDMNFDVLNPLFRRSTPNSTAAGAADGSVIAQFGAAYNYSVEGYRHLARSCIERERCQQLLREIIIYVADAARSKYTAADSDHKHATAAEIAFGDPSRLGTLLHALSDRFNETQRSVLVNHRAKFEEAVAVATIFVVVARAVDESREEMSQFYLVPRGVQTMLWTSCEMEEVDIKQDFTAVCTAVSNTLAEVTAASNATDASSVVTGNATQPQSWAVSVVEQLRLLDLIALMMHFLFRNHFDRCSSFYSKMMRSTVFREPFLCEPLGYPFGAPRFSADATLGAAVLHLCEELALEFTVGDVLVAICLAEPVEDSLQQKNLYEKLGNYCQRNPEMYNIALRSLLALRREWELQLLPELLPAYEAATVARDTFLMQDAPQLAWLVKPTAFHSLTSEGVWSPAYLSYGDDLVTHRSRCLSMAKLAWIAAGAPTTSSYYAMSLDDCVVEAQKTFLLPESKNEELGPVELVQRLLKLPSIDAWVAAARVSCLVDDDLREGLLTQILRRGKQHDGEALQKILQDGASELDVSRALEETAIGRILIGTDVLRGISVVSRVWNGIVTETEQRLLTSWMHTRATGCVA